MLGPSVWVDMYLVISAPTFPFQKHNFCAGWYIKMLICTKLSIMRTIIILFFSFCFALNAVGQSSSAKGKEQDKNKAIQEVEVSCGKCKLGLPGKGCDMAVRVDGKAYYADGASIDDFGDAHAHDGMCNAIRKAEVQGEVVDNRFKISYMKLLPQPKKEKEQ